MKYLIVEPFVKAIAPNIALMKWARWCELNDHQYQYVRGIVTPDIEPDKILMSCIFTFYSKKYEKTIKHYFKLFPNAELIVGGVFPSLNPDWFLDLSRRLNKKIIIHNGLCSAIEFLIPRYNVQIKSEKEEEKYRRDTVVLYASRGCVNRCRYCAVPSLEGQMRSFSSIADTLAAGKEELNSWKAVLYDNNFTEHTNFQNIVLELNRYKMSIDIHGLHVNSFNKRHARYLSMLKWIPQSNSKSGYIRFSFDKKKYRNDIKKALKLVKKYRIKANFFCYLLYNFEDSPDDFWWRIEEAQKIVNFVGKSITLFPQRYEPFDSLERNSYIAPNWTKEMLIGLSRLYTNSGLGNFITINRGDNIYRYLGKTKEEFFDNIIKCYEKEYKVKEKVDYETLGILKF